MPLASLLSVLALALPPQEAPGPRFADDAQLAAEKLLNDEAALIAAIRAGMAAAEKELPEPSDGALRGAVRDESENPIEGAVVRLWWRYADTSGVRPQWRDELRPPRSLEESLRAASQSWLREQRTTFFATTNERGEYAFRNLPRGTVSSSVYRDGWRIRPQASSNSHIVGSAAQPTEVDFVARPVVEVELDLRLPDGSQPTGATLHAVRSSGSGTGWTPDSPKVVLSNGPQRLVAHASKLFDSRMSPGSNVTRFVSEPFVLRSDLEGEALRVELREQSGITGRLVDAEERLKYPWVSALPAAEADDPQSHNRRPRPEERLALGDGHYAALGLAPGRWVVRIGSSGQPPCIETVVDVTEGLIERDLVVPPGTQREQFVLRTASAPGVEAVDVTQVLVERELRPGTATRQSVEWWRRPDGSLFVSRPRARTGNWRLPETGDPLQMTAVVVSSRRHGTARRQLPPGSPDEVEVLFERPCELRLTLDDWKRFDTLERAEIELRRRESVNGYGSTHRIASERSPVVLEEGVLNVEPIQPGEYELTVGHIVQQHVRETILSIPVRAESGVQPISVELPELHDLTLSVPALAPGARVRLELHSEEEPPPIRIHRDGKVDGDWTVLFEDLPPGKYRVIEPNVLERNYPSPLLVEVPAEHGLITIE